MARLIVLLHVALVAFGASGAARADDAAEFATLRDEFVARSEPLEIEAAAAKWEAMTTGSAEAVARQAAAERALVELQDDAARFARLKALRERGQVRDPVLRRELDVLYRRLLPAQGDDAVRARIIGLETELQGLFTTHRSRVGDQVLTANEIGDLLLATTDNTTAEAAWRAAMEVGAKADAKLRELVRSRNELARQLGYRDFFEMSLDLEETVEHELFRVLDELDELSRAPFAQVKRQIDVVRAARFGVAVEDLRPWHYGDPFFQGAPPVSPVNLDAYYEKADLAALARKYFAGVGLSVDDVLASSDLYEREGKWPSGYTIGMDRRHGRMRILVNLQPNARWANTLLHELGHCMNDQYIRPEVPYLLRGPAHALTTEGVAMMFGAMAKNEDFLARVLEVDPAEAERIGRAARDELRADRLVFCRWVQVMVRFEQQMYGNPDQPLGPLWYSLKKRYQLLNPPDSTDRPDYAAKMHILTAPVYYHSYLLGELFASQVRHCVAREVLGGVDPRQTSFYGHPEVGAYLRDRVFGPGNLNPWNEYVRGATGEPLTAKYYALDLREQ